jgi:hypothetical protein
MHLSARPSLLYVLTCLLTLTVSCAAPGQEKTAHFGAGKPVSLLIIYKTGATDDQVNDFLRDVLSRPHPQAKGYDLRDGIALTFRPPSVEGHDATALTFSADATAAQREEITRAVKASPIVYRVLENVAPADVKRLD